MFRCEATGKLSEPNQSCQKVIVETRPKTYIYPQGKKDEQTAEGYSLIKGLTDSQKIKNILEAHRIDYKTSEGFEIIKEAKLTLEAKIAFEEGRLKWNGHKFVKSKPL